MSIWLYSAAARRRGTPAPAASTSATPVSSHDDSMPRTCIVSGARPPEATDAPPRGAASEASVGASSLQCSQQRAQAVLIEHRHAQLARLVELAARVLAGDHVVGLLRHRAGDFAAGRLDLAEVLGQVLRGALADMANAQRIQEARQRRALALLDRRDEVGRALVGHALQRRELRDAQLVELRQGAHDAAIDELVDELAAQALDVHGAAAREMQHRLLALCAAEQAPRAAPIDLALLARDRAAAHRAL